MLNGIEEAKEIISMKQTGDAGNGTEELDACQARQPELEEHIKLLLVPADPLGQQERHPSKFVEVQAVTKPLSLPETFSACAQILPKQKGWRMEISSSVSEGVAGGFKGSYLQRYGPTMCTEHWYESGVHRVQRVPATETQGVCHYFPPHL